MKVSKVPNTLRRFPYSFQKFESNDGISTRLFVFAFPLMEPPRLEMAGVGDLLPELSLADKRIMIRAVR